MVILPCGCRGGQYVWTCSICGQCINHCCEERDCKKKISREYPDFDKGKKMTLDEIKQSPSVEGKWDVDKETGKQRNDISFAFYSVSCCWWTSFPEDLGKTKSAKTVRNNSDGTKSESNGISLPCCPHCSSLLFKAALDKFIKSAESHSDYYGEKGIETFAAAHHRNSDTCHQKWNDYEK